ncbi:hypothetical protein ACROYT_G035752 [Oculina patagonica]
MASRRFLLLFTSLIVTAVVALYIVSSKMENEEPDVPQMLSWKENGLKNGNIESSKPNPEENQKARKKRLNDYCLTHSFNEKPTREELQYISVDDENKIIYCALHKVASKTWIGLLEDALGIKPRVRRWSVFRRLGDYSQEEQSLRLKTYFKFLIVREPLHRLLSAFKERYPPKAPQRGKSRIFRQLIVLHLRPDDFNPKGIYQEYDVSFSEFVQYLSKNVTRNPPCRQYEKMCHPCYVKYDFISHFENMGEEGPLVLQMMGIADRVSFPRIHRATDTIEVMKYYSQVPPRYLKQLGEQYRSDYEMFGYEYLGPVRHLLNETISNGH